MGVEVTASIRIAAELRDDQELEDRFELAVARTRDRSWGDSFYLNAGEVRILREQLDAALAAADQADAALAAGTLGPLEQLLEAGEALVAEMASGAFSDEPFRDALAEARLVLRRGPDRE